MAWHESQMGAEDKQPRLAPCECGGLCGSRIAWCPAGRHRFPLHALFFTNALQRGIVGCLRRGVARSHAAGDERQHSGRRGGRQGPAPLAVQDCPSASAPSIGSRGSHGGPAALAARWPAARAGGEHQGDGDQHHHRGGRAAVDVRKRWGPRPATAASLPPLPPLQRALSALQGSLHRAATPK